MSQLSFARSLFLCLQFVFAWTNQTPVLLWGANSSSKPTLALIRQNEFADLMKPLFEENAVVAFLEPNLTSMDFMCRNSSTGNSCYTYMESAMPRTYYARVQSPVEALKAIASQIKIRSADAVSRLETPISCETGKLTIISFNQSGTERNRHLQSHDSVIASITRMVKCPIVYIYTSTQNSTSNAVVRKSRNAPIKMKQKQDIGTLLRDPLFVIFFKNVTLDENQKRTYLKLNNMVVNKTDSKLSIILSSKELSKTDSKEPDQTYNKLGVKPDADSQEINQTDSKLGVQLGSDSEELNSTDFKLSDQLGTDTEELNQTDIKPSDQLDSDSEELNKTDSKVSVKRSTDSKELNGTESKDSADLGTELSFDVLIDSGYYVINEFVLRGVHYRAFEVETPVQMSYFCGNLELRSNNTKLTWHSLQFQGGHGQIFPNKHFKFYDAWHCVGFFTPPILSGIFVMILLIYITSIGVCWIMDITSNDRFEDPSKEPIRISFED